MKIRIKKFSKITTMGKRAREKRERREKGLVVQAVEKPEFGLEALLKRIIFIGTCLILFTPLIVSGRFFFPFVGPKSLYFMGLVEIIFFTYLFLISFSPKYRPRFNPLLIALTLFLIILILASLFGADLAYSFWSKFERMTGILMLLHLFAFFLVTFTVFKERDWIKFFAISILVGVILCLVTLISKDPIMRGGATVGNDSFLGTYLIFNLFLALYLIFKTKGGLRLYSSICFSITALIFLFGDAQAAKLSFLGGLILLLFLWLSFEQRGKIKTIGRLFLSFLIILAIIFTILAFQPESFVRKQIIERTVGETFGGRFIVWQGAWKGFLERPWLGWGLENFEYSFVKHYDPCFGSPGCGSDIWYDRAHNIVFDALVTSGIIGFLGYLIVFGTVFWLLAKRYFQRKIGFLAAGIFSVMLVSYFVQNLTVFDMVSSYMMFFLVLSFVGHLAFSGQTTQLRERNVFPNFLAPAVILILFIFSFFNFILKPLATDFYAIEALKAKDSSERVSLVKKALKSSPVSKNQIRTYFSEQLQLLFQKEITDPGIILEIEFLSQELEKTVKESPFDFRSYLRLGQIYNIWARFDQTKILEAERILKKAMELSPVNQQTYWALAQNRIYQGNLSEAFSLAEKALELEPTNAQSHLIIIQIAGLTENEDLIQRKVEEALKINPLLEPTIKEILGR